MAKEKKKTGNHQAHVSAEKKKTVAEIVKLIDSYPIIAALNMENLPAKQLQTMRGALRDSVVMLMSKRTLITHAIDQSKKPNIQELKKYLEGMPALLFSKENPFKLYKIIDKKKSKAPIKPGQTAPNDIIVPAGPTSFAPGPIIGELGQFRIKTGIEGGKVAIKENAVVAKKGEIVKGALASILQRMNIEPMEIGLDLVAVYENGEILTKDILFIDETVFLSKLSTAASDAMKLAMEVSYPAKETIVLLIGKSHRDAKAAAIEAGILSKDTLEILAKAEAQASALHSRVN
jgi:large subunit ribosomal protein L10